MTYRFWLGVGTLVGVVGSLVAGSCWADEYDSARAANWHQWRGPDATGTAPQGDPPTNWDEQTNIKWKVAIPGRGSASPIVWGDRIFILTAIKTDRQAEPAEDATVGVRDDRFQFAVTNAEAADSPRADRTVVRLAQLGDNEQPAAQEQPERRGRGEGRGRGGRGGRGGGRGGFGRGAPPTNFYQFVVLCLDRRTGQTIWQQIANESVPHEGHHQTGSFASGSPITDGRNVYALFGSYGVYCYDMNGNLQWSKDLGDMQTRNGFGEGASPALDGDTLVVNWDHEGDSKIYALDARTGDVKWEKPRDERTTWNTPLVAEYNGRTQVITNGTNRSRSYDLATGELLWECGGQTDNPIPSPMRLDDLAVGEIAATFLGMEQEARDNLRAEGLADTQIEISRALGMRYLGQSWEMIVDLPDAAGDAGADASPSWSERLIALFADVHDRRFGHRSGGVVEIVSFRLAAVGRLTKPRLSPLPAATVRSTTPTDKRRVYFSNRFEECAVYARENLRLDEVVAGPAVIEESGSTTIIPPGWMARTIGHGELLMERVGHG